MTRMRLNIMAERGSVSEVAKTFRTMVGILVGYIILDNVLGTILIARLKGSSWEYDAEYYDAAQHPDIDGTTLFVYYVRRIVSMTFSIYLFVALYRTRKNVRESYSIPTKNCGSCEDACCTFFCPCPTTMQLMRQTADYDTYAATCCTETGLPSHVTVDAPISNAV